MTYLISTATPKILSAHLQVELDSEDPKFFIPLIHRVLEMWHNFELNYLFGLILVSSLCIFPIKAACRDVVYNADCDPREYCDAKSWSCREAKEGKSE